MIVFDGVTKVYKRRDGNTVVALDGLTVRINEGDFTFIVGPSGSGKSTMMKLLTREQRPDSGTVAVDGRDLRSLRPWHIPKLRRNIGYIFQDFKLLPNKNVYENVSFAMEVIGRPKKEIKARVPEVLDLVGLTEKSGAHPYELSGGQQQRVSVARAFVNDPKIMLCDEPTGNLDPETSVDIMRLLHKVSRQGTTVLMATHNEDIVDMMRRRVIQLHDGKAVRDDERGSYS